jgi:hypothetical protein
MTAVCRTPETQNRPAADEATRAVRVGGRYDPGQTRRPMTTMMVPRHALHQAAETTMLPSHERTRNHACARERTGYTA